MQVLINRQALDTILLQTPRLCHSPTGPRPAVYKVLTLRSEGGGCSLKHSFLWLAIPYCRLLHYTCHPRTLQTAKVVDSSWNVIAHGDARKGKWRVNWRMEWVASTLHTTSEHGVSSITTADAHTSAASSRLNWRPPADSNGLVRFARKTKSGFCACAITFQLASTS